MRCVHFDPSTKSVAHVPLCLFYSDLLLAIYTYLATQYAGFASETLCIHQILLRHERTIAFDRVRGDYVHLKFSGSSSTSLKPSCPAYLESLQIVRVLRSLKHNDGELAGADLRKTQPTTTPHYGFNICVRLNRRQPSISPSDRLSNTRRTGLHFVHNTTCDPCQGSQFRRKCTYDQLYLAEHVQHYQSPYMAHRFPTGLVERSRPLGRRG